MKITNGGKKKKGKGLSKKNTKNIQITFHPHPLIKGSELYEQQTETVKASAARCVGLWS
jgi:hypothetical protein